MITISKDVLIACMSTSSLDTMFRSSIAGGTNYGPHFIC